MRQIFVEPDHLDEIASKVEVAKGDYERLYRLLYSEVDKMSSVWQGKDNIAFTEQIQSYEEDFKQMTIIMQQYVDFLKNSARAYRETQDELYSQAQKLYR